MDRVISVQDTLLIFNLGRKILFTSILYLCSLLGVYAQVTPNNGVVYVAVNGTGTGWSWAQAASIQNAISTAPAGTELRLRQGIYVIGARLSTARTFTINGGYTGASLTARNPTNNPSVLDGGGVTQIMSIGGNGSIVDGIQFRGGLISTTSQEGGSAIYLRADNVTIRNCTFRNNVSNGVRGGGALFIYGSQGNTNITNCIFENNRVNSVNHTNGQNGGGAIHNWTSNTTITDCTFDANTSGEPGGAVYTWGLNLRIINTNFTNNHSDDVGGALHINGWGDHITITNGAFDNNSSGSFGGAIYGQHNLVINGTAFRSNKSAGSGGAINVGYDVTTITSATFTGNESQTSGGAIYNNHGATVINSSRFTENNAVEEGGAVGNNSGQVTLRQSNFVRNSSAEGGAIYMHRFVDPSLIDRCNFNGNQATRGGAIFNFSDDGLKVVNSLFNRNQAADLGGAVFNERFISITNSTFVGNNNTALVHNRFTTSTYNTYQTNIYNSIFYLNTAKNNDYLTDIAPEVGGTDGSGKDIRRNIVQAYTGGTDNLMGVDPLFVSNSNDFNLQQGSPAANVGNNSLFNQVSPTAAGASRDLANNPRLFGVAIDLGAYELQQQSTPVVPSCANITAPTNNATGVAQQPTITWNAVATATGYRLYIGTTAGGSEIVNGQNVGNVTTYTLTTALNNNILYYVRVIPFNTVGSATGCTENRFRTIAQTLPPPTAEDQIFCGSGTVAALVANGANLRWYLAATGGTALATTTTLQTRSYYVSQTVSGMESARRAVSVTVRNVIAPIADDQSFCTSATVANLQATGTGIRWYTQAIGGVPLASSAALTTRTYYVSQTVGTCTSPRTAVAVTIIQINTPTVSAQSFCTTATVADLAPSDATIRWYDQATGGTVLTAATALQSSTYYVSRVSGNCESARATVEITVGGVALPDVENQSFCAGATVADLQAGGTNLQWYDEAVGGTALTSRTILQTGTYYVTQQVGTCESDRKTFLVTIGAITAPTINEVNICGAGTIADLATFGTNLRWYRQQTDLTSLLGSESLITGTYWVSRTSGICESDKVPVDIRVTVTPIPTIPNQAFTPGDTFADLEVTGVNIRWYDSPTGANVIDPNATIQDGIFYVTQTIDGCESDRVIIEIEITQTSYSYTFSSATFAYDGDDHRLELSGDLPPDAEVVYTNNGRTDAGSQQVTVTVSAPGVVPVILNASLTIIPALLTVTAEAQTKVYGDSDPVLIYQVVGYQGTDDISVLQGQMVRQVGEDVGIYSIEQGALEANGNYTIQFVSANLVITPRNVRVSILNQSKIYGDQDPTLRYNFDVMVPPLEISGQPIRDVGENIGSYTIGIGSLSVTSNYNITAVQEGQLLISPAQLVVRARDTIKTLDLVPFVGGNGVAIVGLKAGDTPSGIQGQPVYEGNSQGAVSQGVFNIEVSGLSYPNYVISFVPGSLRIEGENYYFPNVITPNGDGLNDSFVVKKTYNMLEVRLLVVNTDGLEVYYSQNYQDDFSGKGLNKGTYFYVLHFSLPESPNVYVQRKGFLTIL